jgi:hypothetical protein
LTVLIEGHRGSVSSVGRCRIFATEMFDDGGRGQKSSRTVGAIGLTKFCGIFKGMDVSHLARAKVKDGPYQ